MKIKQEKGKKEIKEKEPLKIDNERYEARTMLKEKI